MNTNLILESKTLAELIDAIEDFCRHSIIRENDDEVMQLRDQINEIIDNDYIVMLSAYMCTAEDGDEIIEALYEFVSNCKGFVEVDEEMTQQVTKEEFEEVLSECEDKCALMSCIEESHTINAAEVPMYNKYREFGRTQIYDCDLDKSYLQKISNEEKEVLDYVLKNFAIYNGKVLEHSTHRESPWLEAREGYFETEASDEIIRKDSIKEYFENIKEEFDILKPDCVVRYIQMVV